MLTIPLPAVTRLKLEGGEIIEVADSANLKARAITSKRLDQRDQLLPDAEYFAEILLDEATLILRARLYCQGPAYEPGDELWVRCRGGRSAA